MTHLRRFHPPRIVHDRQAVLDAAPETVALWFASATTARVDELFVVRPNNRGSWVPWPDDRLPAGAYAVHLADGRGFYTLGLDIDGDGAGSDALAAVAVLRHADVQSVLTRSGPHDRWHVLATFTAPIPPSAMARMVRDLRRKFPSLNDVNLRNPETGAIRPPLSPHRLGGRSEVVGTVADALNILETRNPPEAWRHLAQSLVIPLLGPRMERLLREGDVEGLYSSRSEVVHAIALAHANAGSSEEHMLDDLLDPLNLAGEKVRAMPRRQCQRYVHRSWLRACDRVKRSPVIRTRPDALAQLARIRAAVEAAPWAGRVGAVTYLVLQTHLAIAENAGGPDYFASVRDIADLAEVSVRTVIPHHKRLFRAGWLRRRGLRYPGQATRWRLLCPGKICHQSHPPSGGVRCMVTDLPAAGWSDSAWDLWRYRGLGKIALRVWDLLGGPGAPVDKLSARLGVTPKTVRRHLGRMERLGLVRRDGERWVRTDDALSLELAALTLGVAGEGRKQRERHQRERFAFHAKREGLIVDPKTGEVR